MKQGAIWKADLEPSKGSEQAGFRPVVIISGELLNQQLPIVIVCPLTTKVKHYKGNIVLRPDDVNNLEAPSEVLVFHIRSVSKFRLIERVGTITDEELNSLMEGLGDILRY